MKTLTESRSLHIAFVIALSLFLLGADGDRFNELGHKMMCKCGCNQVLLECNHVGCSYSDRMRAELQQALDRGDSDDLILQGFVQKYGATVLAAPTTTGFNRVAWIMPFLAFALGIVAVVYVVRLWNARRPSLAPAGGAGTPAELDAFRERARQETEI